jgi:DHA3 family macrolide efflux protein-like MFS transporter
MIPPLGVFVGLCLGLAVGGSIDNLVDVRLRWMAGLLAAAAARLGLDWALANGGVPDAARLWLVAFIYVLLIVTLLANRNLPGMAAAALGTAANGIAIVANGGWMPVWQPSLAAAGFDPNTVRSGFHELLSGPMDASFVAHAGPLADVIPIPVPLIQSVASIGDLLLAAGLGFFMFAALVRAPVLVSVRVPVSPASQVAALPLRGALAHPYVRLATNGPFSAMWLAQVVSSLGDRVHQIALVFLVAGATNASPLALGLVFAAMTVPTFLVGPVAGALVDRWDRKRVMVGSDLVRAGLVFAIPVVANLHIGLVVALVLLVAVASSFFRPARTAALPQVVPVEDLLTANSAMSVADTFSDLAGYGLGGLFVAVLGSALSLAFWLDAASYVASAALVASVTIPPVAQAAGAGVVSVRSDLLEGWRFLRAEAVLFATTVQAVVGELGMGALMALSPLLITALPLGNLDAPTAYGFFEMSMGFGLVGGGLTIGAVAGRLPKGPAIVGSLVLLGLTFVLLAVTRNLVLVLILAAANGLANVALTVPSQTIFQQRTPGEMLGRVVAIRLAMVNAALAGTMVTGGYLAAVLGIDVVLAGCGILSIVAGLAGLGVRAIRYA